MKTPAAGSALAHVAVDLDVISANVAALIKIARSGNPAEAPDPELMAVVKADGYGHGMVPAARAARAGGAHWLGVAQAAEALELRAAGDRGPLLCWLTPPGFDFTALLQADVEVTASSLDQLDAIASAAQSVGVRARCQLKVDTGLSRNGIEPARWAEVFAAAARWQQRGTIEVTGLWSHFASADEPEHPANDAQEGRFLQARALAAESGLAPRWCHLANSAATISRPSSRFDLVRCGIAIYGLSPMPNVHSAAELGLVPAMEVAARFVAIRDLPGEVGVSYGHRFVTAKPTKVGLVPMGYAEGIPRSASNRGEVGFRGERLPVLGTVCMDQFVVGAPAGAEVGDEVVVFGRGSDGEPTADDWAAWCETINYEIVTRIGGRAHKCWQGRQETQA